MVSPGDIVKITYCPLHCDKNYKVREIDVDRQIIYADRIGETLCSECIKISRRGVDSYWLGTIYKTG